MTNFTEHPLLVNLRHLVQRNPGLYDEPAPDPVLESDRAQGRKSWLEVDGKRIENNSLTDCDEEAGYSTDWSDPPRDEQAYQYVDLGSSRKIIALRYRAGDANWVYKVDVAASVNGADYQPVSGL